jgi:23S rRNA (cytosine1962-C5)-methyltransferase
LPLYFLGTAKIEGIDMQALLNAIAHMEMPQDAQRVFHGRGGMYPGSEPWALDFYPPVWVLTSFLAVG